MSLIKKLFSKSKARKYSNAEKVKICELAVGHSPTHIFRVFNEYQDPTENELQEFEHNIAIWQAQIYANAKQAFDSPVRRYLTKGLAFILGFAGGICGGLYVGSLIYWLLIGAAAGVAFGIGTTPVGWLILGGIGVGIAGGILGMLTNSAVNKVAVKLKTRKVQEQTQKAEKFISDQGAAEPKLSYTTILNSLAQLEGEKQALIEKNNQQQGQINLLQGNLGNELAETINQKLPEFFTRFNLSHSGKNYVKQTAMVAAIRGIPDSNVESLGTENKSGSVQTSEPTIAKP